MVDDLMDMSHLEQGRLAIIHRPVPLHRVVQDAVDASQALAQQRGVHLVTGGLPPAATVRADEGRLRQVLLALLDNGIKYNRPGGSVTVEVQASPGLWTLGITDTGLGLSSDQIAHLFEPFHRTGRPSSGVAGLGLGLVLVRALVELMGGRLEVASVPGQGSTVSVSLPAEGNVEEPPAADGQTTAINAAAATSATAPAGQPPALPPA